VKTVGELRKLLVGLLDTDPIVVRVDASSPFFPDNPEAELGFAVHDADDPRNGNELVVTVRLLDGDLLASEDDDDT
jgi:hypothetical protein